MCIVKMSNPYPYRLRNVSGTITAAFDSIEAQNTTSTNFSGAGASGIPTYTKLTSGSGTYTTPANCKYIIVEAVGGGGSGGRTSTTPYSSGGGGGGGYFRKLYLPGSYSYSVGAGGTSPSSPNNGNNGGNTTFGSDIAGGGKGGVNLSLYGTGGDGGTCTVSDAIISFSGGGGGAGGETISARGGKSYFGYGSGSVYYVAGSLPLPNAPGIGCGGSGGYFNGGGVSSRNGGDGLILISEYL